MTDIFNEEENQKEAKTKSFKEQILADLAKARQVRQERDEAFLKAEEAAKEAAKKASLQKANEERRHLSEKKTFEPIEIKRDPEIASQVSDNPSKEDVDDVLTNLDQVFNPDADSPTPNSQPTEKASKPEPKQVIDWSDDGVSESLKTSKPTWEKVSLEKPAATEPSDFVKEAKPVKHHVSDSDESETKAKVLPSPKQEEGSAEPSESQEEDSMQQKRRHKRRKTNKIARRIALYLVSIILLAMLALGIFGYTYVTSAIKPVDSKSTAYVQVEIPEGSGNRLIGQILEKKGLIKSATVFNYYTKFKNYGNFQSGYYNLQKSMSLEKIANTLQAGGTAQPSDPVLGKVLIPEGYTIKQISEAITSNANTKSKTDKTPFTAKAFLEKVKDKTFIEKMVKKYPKLLASLPDASKVKYQLEGYLFPATYTYSDKTSVEDMIDSMLKAMDDNLSAYYDTIASKNLTVNEVLTLASLVEKEGATDDDRKKIASVFYNRLNQDMPLQSNIAILYATDKLGTKTTLAEDAAIDTSIDSPYNIYKNTGLMPGAVDNPGLSAIKATIEPDSTDYLYFVADVTTGNVYYAKTYDEHEANVEKYVNSKLTTSSSD
ncbi:endolytic transglycosylase MltG [Streptococcus ferus]|uniref:endolytic transglycosylase MltG n=1 Tax=Streptococcus ferus TaxID=1345 RepID=UPI0035A004F5